MITIAIPFYNAEHYLLDAIRSVFAQTYEDWELILIDDGSTDASLEIAKSINDPRVWVLSDGNNKRLAARLNEVTKLAKYDFIARMDADDLMLPNRIAEQLKYFKMYPEADIVTSGVFSVLNDLSLKGIRGQEFQYPSFEDIVSRKKGVTHAALIARKSWYERNLYNENLKIAQDLELWIRASAKNDFKVISIEDPLYIYREEDNVTGDKLLRAYHNERHMISKYCTKGLKIKLLLKSNMKTLFVKLLMVLGKVEILQKRRANTVVKEKDLLTLDNAIRIINSVKLPINK
ncbi:glycosyltransferase family 2 protein [Aequorivita sinensis]|uniref:glycosyltransferase family 2 protein n=1 Tax=Aequorivita sinensis TaxID=1382458 RepID=UPI00111E3B9D|nr:glycosyltransferase [Aequorivita sinensis]